ILVDVHTGRIPEIIERLALDPLQFLFKLLDLALEGASLPGEAILDLGLNLGLRDQLLLGLRLIPLGLRGLVLWPFAVLVLFVLLVVLTVVSLVVAFLFVLVVFEVSVVQIIVGGVVV